MCKALFFFFFRWAACLSIGLCPLYLMVCFFFVVLGAKMRVVVCLVGVFLVVLARFEMSLHILDF